MTDLRPLQEPLTRPIRLGVPLSGGGTTLLNLLDRIAAGELNAEVVQVIASRADCGGIARAQAAGLPVTVIPRRDFDGVEPFSEAVFAALREARVDLVVLAGFLSRIEIPDDYAYRVLNIHPSLIPAFCGHGFYGSRVHAAAIERGVKLSGCTVHFADNQYDHGPIILQRSVPVHPDDGPDELAARVFTAECEAYPEAIRLFAAARLQIEHGRVRILPR